jgi:hypothetical protein
MKPIRRHHRDGRHKVDGMSQQTRAILFGFAAWLMLARSAGAENVEEHDSNSVYWRLRGLADKGELSARTFQTLVSIFAFDGIIAGPAAPDDFVTIVGDGKSESEPLYVSLTLNGQSLSFYR